MKLRYPLISKKVHHFLHGCDYNPDQWLHMPEIIKEDFRLMDKAHVNVMTLGVFSWTTLEPEDGKYEFRWLDDIMDRLADSGRFAIMATPSGAKPGWLAKKYPETLRVDRNRNRDLWHFRHNHCPTSPEYRRKITEMNVQLAKRYKDHPALIMWHISNELSGECHCPLCHDAFRNWLKKKYHGDLDRLNRAWYNAFWSHQFTDWSQVESRNSHCQTLDWKRFVTDQFVDYMQAEIKPIREITPEIPITTNFMGTYPGLNYWKFAPYIDVISWDSYPTWHGGNQGGQLPDPDLAADTGFSHDLNRSMKQGRPFMLMESTPSVTNWQQVPKLKRPGVHLLSSLQAVAHGSDTVQYFQWRKSRGFLEKFHGAVVDHSGHENTRTFRDVAEVGQTLEKLDEVLGTSVPAEVGLIYDWECRWTIEDAHGPRQDGEKKYEQECKNHYKGFWKQGIPIDVIDMDQDFSKYKVLVAPMLYLLREGVADRIEKFVSNGGTFISTYLSGVVNETDLTFIGGFPGPLRKMLGIWSEELDCLQKHEFNPIVFKAGKFPGMKKQYKATIYCDLIHLETAEALAVYKNEFYAGRPAVTKNKFGKGLAYYIASRNEQNFMDDFYRSIATSLGLRKVFANALPPGVNVAARTDGKHDFIFLMNFTSKKQLISIGKGNQDMITGVTVKERVTLKPYGCLVLKRRSTLVSN